MKKIVVALLVFGAFSISQANESTAPDAVAVDSACSQDAATAGCGSEKVGTGLLKCLHAYKKANMDKFKFTDGCKAAMQKLHADKKK